MSVSLQINLSPGDYPLARHLLAHQLKVIAGQVEEVLLVVETKPSNGRFGEGWEERCEQLYHFLQNDIASRYNVRIIPVDYSENKRKEVSAHFFLSGVIPEKDFRGGPFYAYFFGLYAATGDMVMHLDADMFLGGGSQCWIQEACQLLRNEPDCLITAPLPGPPRPDHRLIGQQVVKEISAYAYELEGVSTRIFFIDKSKFAALKMRISKPRFAARMRAVLRGNPIADLPEHLFQNLLADRGLKRIDFLGAGKGLWSLHPPYRCQKFYDALPELINKIEQFELPETQLGFYDIVDELCDWSEARKKLERNRWWKKMFYVKIA